MDEKLGEVRRLEEEVKKKRLVSELKRMSSKRGKFDGDQGDDDDMSTDESEVLTKLEANDELPPLTTAQRRLGHFFFLIKIVLSLCNLTCFVLKVPFLVFVIRAVLEVLNMRHAQTMVSTLEPPYGAFEGMHIEATEAFSTSDGSTNGSSNGSSAAAKIEMLCLLLLYVGMLVVHLDVGCVLFCSSKCKGCLHLVFYFPLVGLWLFFAAFAYFVDTWTRSLNYVFLVFKMLIFDNELFETPRTFELALLRSSLFLDVVTFLLTAIYALLVIVWKKKKLPPHCVHNWKPHFNLIRLL